MSDAQVKRLVEEMVLEKHDQEYTFKTDEQCAITKVKTDGFTDYEIVDRWSKKLVNMFKRRKMLMK